jgi:hypothetical protein
MKGLIYYYTIHDEIHIPYLSKTDEFTTLWPVILTVLGISIFKFKIEDILIQWLKMFAEFLSSSCII